MKRKETTMNQFHPLLDNRRLQRTSGMNSVMTLTYLEILIYQKVAVIQMHLMKMIIII